MFLVAQVISLSLTVFVLCDAKYIIKKYAGAYFSEILSEKQQNIKTNNDKKSGIY